jgi:transcriptional regulator with XRE-family HTH domain
VSGKFIGLIERGAGNPTLDVLDRVAEALEVELWQLLRFEETRPQGNARNAARAFAAAEKVATYLATLSAAEAERALRIVEAALGEDAE